MLPSQQPWIAYIGDGNSTRFVVPFFYVDPQDLLVTVAPSGAQNQPVSQILGVDYAIVDVAVDGARYNGGTVVFLGNSPLAGTTILISRRTPREQDHIYAQNDPFPAKSHELALDRVTGLIQEIMHNYQGVADGPPTMGNYTEGAWFIARKFRLGGVLGWVYAEDSSNNLQWFQFGSISLLSGVL